MKKTVMNIKAFIMSCMFMCATASLAANGIWSGTVDALWTNSANWSASPYPSGNDTAFFTNNVGPTTLNVAGLSSIKYITFDSPFVAAYTLGTGAANSQTLIMVDGGEFKLTDTAANSQLFNCGVQLGANVTAQNYSFKNDNIAQTLTFNKVFGSAAGGGTAGDKTLTIIGAGNTTILGDITKGGAAKLYITDNSSGTLTLSGSNTITTLNMNGGTNSIVDIGAGFLALDNGGGTSFTSSQGGAINGTGTLWLKGSGDNSVAAGKTLTVNVPITSDGILEVYGNTGTFVLNATNTFPGEVQFNMAGAISAWKVGNKGALDSNLGKGTNINFNANANPGAKLIYTGTGEDSDRTIIVNYNAIIDHSGTGLLKFIAPLTASGNAKTLTLQGSTSGIGELAGAIPNAAGTSLAKNGTGTWILSGTNTYGGATTVSGGKLLVNSPGISSNSIVTVTSGAILGGNSTIYGNVVSANGMLAPADLGTIGTLSLGGTLTLTNSTLLFDISNVATDKVSVVGALNVNGTNTVVLSFLDGTLPAGTNTLMTFASRTGTGTFVLPQEYVNASLVTNATSVQLVVSEPGTSSKKWTGADTGDWNTTDLNWTNGIAAVAFATGDAVMFDDTASIFNVGSASPVVPGSVQFNNSISNYVVSAAIDGAGQLFKLGTATVTLAGNNTYAGQTTIAAGMLTIGEAGVLGNGNYATNIINNGTLSYASSLAQTNSGVISGSGALIASGSGALTLSGANTYTGPTTVNAGSVLKIQNGAGLGTIAAGTTVNAGGTLELAGNIATLAEPLSLVGTLSSQMGINTYAGAITFQPGAVFNIDSGSTNIISVATVANGFGFTKMGTGTLRLTADPAQNGPFMVNEGVLELMHGGSTDAAFIIAPGATLREMTVNDIGDVFAFTNNGTFDMRVNDTIATLVGNGLVTVGAVVPAVTLGIGADSKVGTFSGVIQNGLGTMNVTKSGTGIQILTGANTYTGPTTVSAGTLLVNTPGYLAAGSALTVASAAILGGNGSINGPVTLSAGGNLAPGGVDAIGTLTLGSSLTLNGNRLFFDISNVATDTVAIATALTATGVNTVVINGALPVGDYTLMTFASGTAAIPFSLVGISNATLELAATSLILHVTSGGGGASLTWEGDKSLIWDDGILNWLNGSTPSAFSPGDAVLFDDTAFNFTVNSGSPVSPASVLFNNNVNVYTVNAIISGSTAVSKFGTVNANLTGVNTYTGPTIVNQGTLAINIPGQLGSGNYAQEIIINNGATFHYASTANQILSGLISGGGAFTKSGSSTLILTNANTYAGTTAVSGGTLIAKEFLTAMGTGALTLNSSTLELANDTGLVYGKNTTVSGNATVKSGRLTLGVGVTNTLGTLSINGSTLTVSQGANISSGTAGLTLGTTTMTGAPVFDVGTGTLLTLGALGGNFNFTKNGVGTLFFGLASSRTGVNSTLTAGTLKLGNAAGLGTIGTTNVLNGGILDLAVDTTVNAYKTIVGGNTTIQSDKVTVNSAGITHTLGTLSIGAFTLNVTNGPNVSAHSPFGLTFGTVTMTGNATFNVENNGLGTGSLTLGAVGGAFALTKNGSGTLILPGANIYSGVTTVNGGTLLVNGTLSTNLVTVNSGAILGGSGTITGKVNMVAGSLLAPGGVNATNILTLANNSTNSLTLNGNTLLFDLPASGTVCDKINITGASGKLVLKGANKIALSFPYGSAPAGTYTLMTCSGGISTNAGATLTLLGTYPNATLSVVGNDVVLNVTSTLGLTWKGNLSDVWDNSILNWTNGSAAVSFAANDAVLFDDTASNFTVSSVGQVLPSSAMFNNSVNNYTISAIIGGTGPLVKSGSGTVTLSGTNTVSGGMIVNNGLLILTGTNTGGTAATTINGAGVLQLGNGGTSGTVLGSGTVLSGNNGLQFNRTDPVSSPLVVNNKIDKNGAVAYNVVVNSGAVQIGGTTDNNATAADVKNGATLILAKTSNGSVHALGGNSLVESGGKLILGGTGGDQIYSGISVNVLDGGVFDVNSLSEGFTTLTLAGTGIAGTGALINGTTTATPTLTCAVALSANSSLGGPGNLTIAGIISGASLGITKVGVGTVRLTGDPSLTGAFWVNEGTLELQHSGGTDAPFIIAPGATLREFTANDIGDVLAFTNNGTFDMRVNDTISTLIGSGLVTVGAAVPAVTLGLGLDNKVGAFTGVIENGSGTMNVTKYGTGIQILSGINTYTGSTIVNAGTLVINNPGSLAASAVTVANGATLGGSGILNGTVNMAAGSTMNPGDTNAVGTLTLANDSASALTLNGALLRFDLSSDSGVCDKVVLSGTSSKLVLNGVNVIALSFPYGIAPAGTYTLMTCAGGITTNPGGSLALQNAYPNATLSIGDNDVILTVGVGGTYGLTWKGNVSDMWDSGLNWTNGIAAVAFTEGDHVTFDDTAIGNFTVSSGSPVSPGSVLFNNSINAYTVTAAISGTGPLVKQGTSLVTLSGVSDYNPLLVTVYPSASLALSGASKLNNGNYDGNINNFGTFTYSSSAAQTLSGIISGSGAMIVNNGSLNLSSSSSNTLGAVTVSGGAMGSALRIGGLTSLGANTLLVGNATSSRSVVTIAGDVSLGRVQAGTTDNANSAGAVYHNSGTITASAVALSLGEGTGDFGYYRLASGLMQTTVASDANVATKGHGVLEMTGGVLNLSNAGFIGKGGAAGVAATVNIFGGVLNGAPSVGNYITMGGTAGQSFGQLNVGGSGVFNIAGGTGNSRGLGMMFADNNTNVINLLTGGTIIANKVYAEKTTGRSIFNFNGGTLTTTNTSTVGATFMQGLTAAYVYPGNAVIDTTPISLTVAQPLLGTTDYGVTGFTLTSNGSGYIGAPAVVLLGGSGIGATAIAQHDFDTNSATFGQITGLTVTCPGTGYQAGDTLTVSLRGGGFLTPASATCTLGVNPVSGGLTKLGSGTLTLSGTNTYAGATTISNGTLKLGIANALPTNNAVNVSGGIYDLSGFSVTNGAVSVSAGRIINGSLLASSITVNDTAFITAALTANSGLTKNGPGNFILKGYTGNAISGPLVVNGGTLTLRLLSAPPTNGLSYWLDASDGSKVTLSGSNVTAWADSSAAGVNFTNTVAIQRPVYVTNAINGLPGVSFSGMTNRLAATKTADAQVVFIVNKVNGSRSGNDGIWGYSGNDSGIRLLNATTWVHPTANVNDFTFGGQMFINSEFTNIFLASTPHLLTAVTPNKWVGRTTAIGDYWGPGGGQWRSYNGVIGEVLVYSSILSTNDRQKVEGYLMSKWFGVSSLSLPTVELASGTILDLDGQSQTLANLSGSGTVSNGALTVTGTISPGGTNMIGTLTAKANTTLSGTLLANVATDGTSDCLDVQGDLTLLSPTLEIADLQGLSTIKVYTLATYSGSLTGSFTSTNLPDRWVLRYTTDKIQLYYKSGTMVRIM